MQKIGFIGIAIIVFIISGVEAQPCSPQPVTINQRDQPIAAPSGFNTVFVVDLNNNAATELTMTGSELVVDDFNALRLETAKAGDSDGTRVVLQWRRSADGATCNQRFTIAVDGGSGGGSDAHPAAVYAACATAAAAASTAGGPVEKAVGTEAFRRNAYTLVVMHPKVGLCHASRQFGIQGEPIVTGIFTNSTFQIPRLDLSPCSPRPSGPRVFVQSGGITAPRAQSTIEKLFIVRTDVCYDPTVTVKLTTQPPNTSTDINVTYALQQYPRYHASLQLGALFTDNQQHSFGLRAGPNNTNLITDEGPVDEGPEYYAALMIYGAPHYLTDLFKGQRYDGRELTTERGWRDRMSLVLGAGLSKPAERVGAGLSFEILPGLYIVGLYERAKIGHLNGVAVGDAFAGAKDTIPLKKSWDEQIVFGIGIDGRYATAIFTGK